MTGRAQSIGLLATLLDPPTRIPGRIHAHRAPSTRPLLSGANFKAFESRLISTCVRRSWSPTIRAACVGSTNSSATRFSANIGVIEVTADFTRSAASRSAMHQSMRPASIFAKSSRSLIIRTRRRHSPLMMPRNSWRCSAPISGLSPRISANERIDVSGVRRSCVTMFRNADFAWLASSAFCFAACRLSSQVLRSVTSL